jgi:hypothetical protein
VAVVVAREGLEALVPRPRAALAAWGSLARSPVLLGPMVAAVVEVNDLLVAPAREGKVVAVLDH